MKECTQQSLSFKLLPVMIFALILAFAGGDCVWADQPPADKGDKVVTGADLSFMNEAAPGGMAEVELGHLAVNRAGSEEIRQFGERMIEDHSKAGARLRKLARQKNVELPSKILPQAKQTKEKLSQLSGTEFDRAYVTTMLQLHEKDVAAFTAVAQNATDADVKAFAAETVPTLQQHLEMIRKLAKKMSLPVE